MPISHKYKCIFIHVPKNAGTSITNEFQMQETGHWRATAIKRAHPKEWETYFKFTVVRNPFDRFVSSYNYARMEKSYWHSVKGGTYYGKHEEYDLLKNKSFEECCKLFSTSRDTFKNHCWHRQYPYICDNQGKIMVDFVVRYESFEEDMKYVYQKCGKTPSPRWDNQSTKSKDFLEYYTENTRNIVYNFYNRDFEIFGYNKRLKG